jgi:hypothetical protein
MLQLGLAKRVSQLQFEDGLAKEYRDLINRLPTKILLGARLSRDAYKSTYDELFHYIDPSNEQCMLRSQGRVGRDVWKSWSEGIEGNLKLQAFSEVWNDIKSRTESFQELRKLEKDFRKDPYSGGLLAWLKTGNW